MKRTVFLMVVVMVLVSAAGTVFAAPEAEKVSYTGFLMDKACADMGKGMDGSDIANSPEDHSKKCLLAGPCKESGYGVWFEGDSGYEFIKFDEAGDKVALEEIMNSSKADDFAIEVDGTRGGDVLTVDSLVLN